MENKKIIAIIPARGGSKGIPRKNIRLLAKKPLISYSIEAALNSKYLDRVIVSTDDKEIGDISKKYGAEVVVRPAELARDSSPTQPVLEHAINFLEKKENYKSHILVLLQPTSPLRTSEHINGAIEKFLEDKYDSLLTVCPSHAFIWEIKNGKAKALNYNYKKRVRRQDKSPEFRENGAIYISTADIICRKHGLLDGKVGLYVMPEKNSIEIDEELDLWICEKIIDYDKNYSKK